jgi:hypothetical protein
MHFKINVDIEVPTEDLVQVIKALSSGDASPLKAAVEKLASETLKSEAKSSVNSVIDNLTRNLGETFSDQSEGGPSLPKIIDSLVGSVRPDLKGTVAPQAEAMTELFQGLSGMFMEMMSVKKEDPKDPDVILAVYEEDDLSAGPEPEVKFVELTTIENNGGEK